MCSRHFLVSSPASRRSKAPKSQPLTPSSFLQTPRQGFFAKLFGSAAAEPAKKDMAAFVSKNFPRAVTNAELVDKVSGALAPYGFGGSTLVATSLCCDEVNRVLDLDFGKKYNINFSMGGLAGFAFGGTCRFVPCRANRAFSYDGRDVLHALS
jgi:hypothetical protein